LLSNHPSLQHHLAVIGLHINIKQTTPCFYTQALIQQKNSNINSSILLAASN